MSKQDLTPFEEFVQTLLGEINPDATLEDLRRLQAKARASGEMPKILMPHRYVVIDMEAPDA